MTESAEVDLITNDASFFSFDDDGPTLTVTVEVSETEAAALAVELDETTGDADRYSSADTPDTYVNDDNGYLAQATTNVEGGLLSLFATLGGDYGSDLAGTTVGSLSFIGLPETGGLATNLSATDGRRHHAWLPTVTTKINGVDTDSDVVFSIEIVNVGTVADPVYQLVTTQYEALDHGADDNLFDSALNLLLEGEGSVQLEYEVTRTDGDGDVVTESAEVDLITNDASFFSFDDDGPTLTVTAEVSETEAAALAVELDETTGDADRYSSADTPDTYVNDDNGYLAQATTDVEGGLLSLFATLGGDYGSDLAGTTVGSLSFIGLPATGGLATTLSATDGGAISLEAASATLINGVDTDGDVVFSIEIVNVGTVADPVYQLVTTQYEALDHGADDNLFDSALNLLLEGEGSVQLEYEVTRTDGDGDVVTESAEVDLITNDASFFSFDDDGPTLTVTAEVSETEAAALAVELDETTGDADRYSSADTPDTYVNDDNGYLAQATTNVDGGLLSLFATLGGDYGSDLAGTTVGSLSFIGLPETGGLATTLSATDGGAISLEAASATLINGVDTDGDVVFSIEIVNVGTVADPVYQLVTTQYEALDHGADDNLFDSALNLLLEGEGSVQLEYEVTRTDGDGDVVTESAEVDLITNDASFFSFDDDGPT